MIIRWWLILGFIFVAVAWILQVPLAPEPFQATARSAIEGYRKVGLMPPAGTTKISKAVGHDVFEVPKSDARHAKEAAAAGGGMSMPGMKKDAKKGGKGMAGLKPMPGMKFYMTSKTRSFASTRPCWSFMSSCVVAICSIKSDCWTKVLSPMRTMMT